MLAAGSRHGRRCHRRAVSLVADDGELKNFHRSARARPPPADTPDESSAATTSQVTPSIQDFAVSLALEALHLALDDLTDMQRLLEGNSNGSAE